MYAQLEYNPCHGGETKLVLYRSKKAALDDPSFALLDVTLTNSQLGELVLMAKIKPIRALTKSC